jgi:predicted metal-dependent TIM-barrel fold hydrolase
MTEHSFFFVSHATQVGLTHVDAEKHTVPQLTALRLVELIRAAGPKHCILSSDCGVYLLPPPHEGLREFLLLLESCGIDRTDLKRMVAENPASLFKVSGV